VNERRPGKGLETKTRIVNKGFRQSRIGCAPIPPLTGEDWAGGSTLAVVWLTPPPTPPRKGRAIAYSQSRKTITFRA